MGSSTVAAAVVDADVVDADAVLSLDDSGGEWSEIVDHLLEIYDLSSVQVSVCEISLPCEILNILLWPVL